MDTASIRSKNGRDFALGGAILMLIDERKRPARYWDTFAGRSCFA